MGVLEDAIRDHLELKRKHGASDEEVERNELEALGPARREFEAAEEEGTAAEGHAAEVAPTEPVAEADAAAEPEPLPEPEPFSAPETQAEPFSAPEIPPEPSAPEAATRIHESPIPDPALTDPQGPDFVEEEEAEQASEPKPRRDLDFE
jgi:hypothetical protein